MGFHKHGRFSFSIAVQRMSVIGGDRYVADLTGLRSHSTSGAATRLDTPAIAEHYGETARDAERKAIAAVCGWLDQQDVAALLITADRSNGDVAVRTDRP